MPGRTDAEVNTATTPLPSTARPSPDSPVSPGLPAGDHHYTVADLILGPRELAALLRISERHLSDVRREDATFPVPRLVGTSPRWHISAVLAWIATPAQQNFGDTDGASIRQPRRTAAANKAGSRGRV